MYFLHTMVLCCIFIARYWYFGPLKRHWTYLMSTTSRWPPIIQGHFSYVNYCSGCSNCHKPPPKQQWKWWHIFLSPKVEGINPSVLTI